MGPLHQDQTRLHLVMLEILGVVFSFHTRRKIIGIKGVEATKRTQPTESTKQGSEAPKV